MDFVKNILKAHLKTHFEESKKKKKKSFSFNHNK